MIFGVEVVTSGVWGVMSITPTEPTGGVESGGWRVEGVELVESNLKSSDVCSRKRRSR